MKRYLLSAAAFGLLCGLGLLSLSRAQETAAQPQGWVMDGWGGMHPFGGAPRIYSDAYWPGQDIAVQLLLD